MVASPAGPTEIRSKGESSAPEAPALAKAEMVADVATVDVPPQTSSEETNVWPTEAEEAAFLAESRLQPPAVAVVAVRAENAEDADETSKPLPKLDDLVNRIPADARELLEDLFRAKFTTVRRVKKRDLKP